MTVTTNKNLLATKGCCWENSVVAKISKTISNKGVIVQPHNFTGALVCSDGLSVPAEVRQIEINLDYSEPFIHQFPHLSNEYKVEEWTDYHKVKL